MYLFYNSYQFFEGTSGPIFVTEQDINNLPNERGYFIEQYRSDLEKQKVLVLPDLHKVSSLYYFYLLMYLIIYLRQHVF